MNDHKFCFILCSNNDLYLNECFTYLSLLNVPTDYEVDTLVIPDAKSMTAGYNEGMRASDAKYKIYLHQDTFIRNRDFLQDILNIFQADKTVGMIGMIGAVHLCNDGVMWHEQRIGNFYRLEKMFATGSKLDIRIIKEGITEVEVVDGLMMITQYDLPWREDIITGWDFYDVTQCLEFRRAGYKIVVPGQAAAWYIHDCEITDFWHYEAARKIALAAYPDFFKSVKRFLYCNTDLVKTQNLPWGLLELGYEVLIDTGEMHVQAYNARDKDDFAERLKMHCCDYVISHNLSPEIAEACYEVGIPYIAWCYDSPLKELNGWFALHPTSHIFVMDKVELKKLAPRKIPHLHYMHLAGNVTRMQGLIITSEEEHQYSHEIAMVGNLYDQGYYEKLLPEEEGPIKTELMEFVNGPVGVWQPDSSIYEQLSDETVDYLAKKNLDAGKHYDIDNRRFYETMLARDITHRDRVLVLTELVKRWDVHLYTSSTKGIPPQVRVHDWVNPYDEAPKIFHLSKINLNITLRSIETGTPLRIFDIMSVGGFVLSSWQQELTELFVPDKEIVLFRTIDELKEKVKYYLGHEKERLTIAMAGYQKVQKCYSFPKVLKDIINIVDDDLRHG